MAVRAFPLEETGRGLVLEPADYFELRTVILEAQLAQAQAQAAIAKATAARETVLTRLAQQYAFDPTTITAMAWDDATHAFAFTHGAPPP